MSPLTDQGARHPFQVSSFGTFIALGSWWWVTEQGSPTAALLPHSLRLVWYAILALSGILGVTAALLSLAAPSISLLLERAALIGLSGYGVLYVLSLGLKGGPFIAIAAFTITTVAALWRLFQVHRRVKRLRQAGINAA